MTRQGIDISRIPFKWIRGCMHENRITVRFWIVTLLMAAFAIMTLKIR
jgi:phospho-N-acetylmuramoyl-pentapeptide-transferase